MWSSCFGSGYCLRFQGTASPRRLRQQATPRKSNLPVYTALTCQKACIFINMFIFKHTHCSLQSLLCDLGQTFQLASPGVFTCVTTREHPAAEGGTVGEKCLRILPKILTSFTCRKATTWDRRFYFSSEGRRTEDFFALKILPANLGTKGQDATSRPPKPLSCRLGPRAFVPVCSTA